MTKAVFAAMQSPDGVWCLVPTQDDGREIVAAIKRPCIVDVHTPRNAKHHAMLFAVFKMLTDGGVWEGDMDSLLEWMKYATGLTRTSIDHRGEAHLTPRSIAFESMSQDQFKRWFDRVLYVVCQRLLPGQDYDQLRDAIGEVVDGDLGRRARNGGR